MCESQTRPPAIASAPSMIGSREPTRPMTREVTCAVMTTPIPSGKKAKPALRGL